MIVHKKISRFNEEFDLRLLKFIISKTFLFIVLVFIVFIFGGYLIIRYSQPVYESNTIIQIETESQAEQILELRRTSSEQLSQKLELMRSKIFMDRVLSKLPLDVRYYNEGRFLRYELYKSSPFTINYIVYDPVVYDVFFEVTYVNDSLFKLSYTLNHERKNNKKEVFLVPGFWKKLEEIELILHVNGNLNNYKETLAEQRHFLFTISKPETFYSAFISNISFAVLNEIARTIQVSVKDKNPARASDIANQIASEFQLFDVEKKSMSANNILDFIDGQLKNVVDNLTKYEDSITAYKRIHNIDTVTEVRRQSSLAQLNIIESEIIKIQMELNLLNNILDELGKKESADALYLLSSLITAQHQSGIQTEINKLRELMHKKNQMLLHTPENSSFIISLNQQIGTQKNLIEKLVRNHKDNTVLRLKQLNERYTEQYAKAFSGKDNPQFELKRFERLYTITEQFYNQLIEKKIEFSILKAGYISENIILQTATAGAKIYPSKRKILSASFLLALLITLSVVSFKYINFNEIVNSSELRKYSSIPIIGVLPKFQKTIPVNEFIIEKYPKSILAESLRSIRSNLQFISSNSESQVIAITSTVSGEGKTFMSINLAGIFAINGKKVVIIDTDMRRPTVHKFFNLKNKTGMSTILSNQTTMEDSLDDIDKFDIKLITAGPAPPNPAELINSENFDILIKKLKDKFEYIIIDGPPVGLVSDALKSMQIADYSLYILRANYSKRTFLTLPEKIINDYNIKNLSLVLNSYDNTISSMGMEKDIIYSYGYYKRGYRKIYKNYYEHYYTDTKHTFIERIKKFFSKKNIK